MPQACDTFCSSREQSKGWREGTAAGGSTRIVVVKGLSTSRERRSFVEASVKENESKGRMLWPIRTTSMSASARRGNGVELIT